MKNLKLANSISIAIPIVLLLYGIFDGIGFYLSAYSMVITGLLQLIIGVIFWIKFKEDLNKISNNSFKFNKDNQVIIEMTKKFQDECNKLLKKN